MSARERHPADVVRVVVGGTLFVVGGLIAHYTSMSAFERDVFHLVNDLPDGFNVLLQTVMQLGTLVAVAAVVGVALATRRYVLAISAGVAGFGAWWLSHVAKEAVGRGRPAAFFADVVTRGAHVAGLGYPSTHVAVAAALVTGASPFLPRPARRAGWCAVAIVAIARVFVGAHLPLDVIGGLLFGWTIGSLVHLAIGTPCHEIAPASVRASLATSHFRVNDLQRVPDDGNDATPFLAKCDDGHTLFVKALDREHRDADAFAALGRYVAFRHVEDESPFATARQRVEHEALVSALAIQAGANAARPLAIATAHHGPSVLVLDRIDGAILSEAPETHIEPATVDELWRQVAHMRGSRIAHRQLSLNNVMVDSDGHPWIVDFAYAEVGASDRELARDVAELLASLTLVIGPEAAVAGAVNGLGKEAVKDALPLLQPLALATTTRHALRHHHGVLEKLRDGAADAVEVEHVKLEPLTRIRWHQLLMLGGLFVAFYVLVPQFAEVRQSLDAIRHAHMGWLLLATGASASTFLASALSLSGSVLVPLAYGRTVVTQLASSFSNKITPAGLGGMGMNVRYLQRSGVSQADALGAVALNGSVGFVVHVVALVVSATLLGHTGLPSVHVPSWSAVLLGGVLLLSIVGVVLETSFGRKHVLLPTERTMRDLTAVVRRPKKAVQMFGGAVLVLGSYVVALGFALSAVHANASWLDVTTVYLGGSAVASAAPTPGKVGAVEAALIAGLTRVGVASGPAVAGVLAFRLATFWLPIVPGWLAFRSLTKRELL